MKANAVFALMHIERIYVTIFLSILHGGETGPEQTAHGVHLMKGGLAMVL
jgi:hypothetical protein